VEIVACYGFGIKSGIAAYYINGVMRHKNVEMVWEEVPPSMAALNNIKPIFIYVR
jgi:hypothetical protein